jgi:hypothetical protein
MKKVLILIAAVLLTTAVHASDLYDSGVRDATFTAGILCTPKFEITVPIGSPWEVYIGNFIADGITHSILSNSFIIKWDLTGPAKNINGTYIDYMVSYVSGSSNYFDNNVTINTKWRITSQNINTGNQFLMSGFGNLYPLRLKQDGPGVCNGYATFEIIAVDITAFIGADPGIRRFRTTLVVDVSI